MVTICILLGVVALALMGVGAYLLVAGGQGPESIAPPPPAPVPVVEALVAPPAPKPAPVYLTIRWTTARGRVLGQTRIDRRARRGQMVRTYRGKPAVFAASHEDGGVWVYRYLHDV